MTAQYADEPERVLPFVMELLTAAIGSDGYEFFAYAEKRFRQEAFGRADLQELVSILALMGGRAIGSWAEATGRDPSAVMQAIALDAAQDDDDEDD